MAKSEAPVTIWVELYKPALAMAGDEALKLARFFKEFGGKEYDSLTQHIRDGFAFNFQQEGTPAGAWEKLADWTVEERAILYTTAEDLWGNRVKLVPGFTPTNPILQRTGGYRDTWIKFGPQHGLEVTMSGDEGLNIEIREGSKDPRAEKLSLGGPSESGDAVPARPVHILDDMFINRMTAFLEGAARQHALNVK